jgi:putative transcriptional regulator
MVDKNATFSLHFTQEVETVNYKDFRMVRTNIGISISELAHHSSLSHVTLTKIESGRINPSLKIIVAICKALNKSPKDFFCASCKP